MLITQRERGDCWLFDVSLITDSDWHWKSHSTHTEIWPDFQVNRMKCDFVLWGCGTEWLEQVIGFGKTLRTWPFFLPSHQTQKCFENPHKYGWSLELNDPRVWSPGVGWATFVSGGGHLFLQWRNQGNCCIRSYPANWNPWNNGWAAVNSCARTNKWGLG